MFFGVKNTLKNNNNHISKHLPDHFKFIFETMLEENVGCELS